MESDETKSVPCSCYLCALYSKQCIHMQYQVVLIGRINYYGTNGVATMYNATKLSSIISCIMWQCTVVGLSLEQGSSMLRHKLVEQNP